MLWLASPAWADLPGYGNIVTGHEEAVSPTTVTVTNCNNSGAGSLRDAIDGTGKNDRYVNFSVSCPEATPINMIAATEIKMKSSNVTVNGCDAPGLITIKWRGIRVDAGTNVIVKCLFIQEPLECEPNTADCDADGEYTGAGSRPNLGGCWHVKTQQVAFINMGCTRYRDNSTISEVGAADPAQDVLMMNNYHGDQCQECTGGGSGNPGDEPPSGHVLISASNNMIQTHNVSYIRNVLYFSASPPNGGDRNPVCSRTNGTDLTCFITNNLVWGWRDGGANSGQGITFGGGALQAAGARANAIGNYVFNPYSAEGNNERGIQLNTPGTGTHVIYTAKNKSQFSQSVTDAINAKGNQSAPLASKFHNVNDACTMAHWLKANVGPKFRPQAIQDELDTINITCTPRRFVRRR